MLHYAVQNVFAQAFKNAGCHVVNKPNVEDIDGKLLIPDHLVLGNGTENGQGLMVDYRHTDSGQTNPLDFSAIAVIMPNGTTITSIGALPMFICPHVQNTVHILAAVDITEDTRQFSPMME